MGARWVTSVGESYISGETGLYRLAANVSEKPSNPHNCPTFTLPRGVALDSR